MAASANWVTWPEAAAIVGCPVPTIDWHTRSGRIEKRPHRGSRPTLRRSSVIAFATWYRQREADRREGQRRQIQQQRQRSPRPAPVPQPPSTTGLTSSLDAAALLGVGPGHVVWLIDRGRLDGLLSHGRWWVHTTSLDDLVRHREAENAAWVSAVDAAALVGCSPGTILRAAAHGELVQRHVERHRPSLSRESVRLFRSVWLRRESERTAERAERRHRPQPKPACDPPDDQHTWLTTARAAERLGLGISRVNQLARLERLPSVRRASRHWYRQDHLVLYLNARRAAREAGESRAPLAPADRGCDRN